MRLLLLPRLHHPGSIELGIVVLPFGAIHARTQLTTSTFAANETGREDTRRIPSGPTMDRVYSASGQRSKLCSARPGSGFQISEIAPRSSNSAGGKPARPISQNDSLMPQRAVYCSRILEPTIAVQLFFTLSLIGKKIRIRNSSAGLSRREEDSNSFKEGALLFTDLNLDANRFPLLFIIFLSRKYVLINF